MSKIIIGSFGDDENSYREPELEKKKELVEEKEPVYECKACGYEEYEGVQALNLGGLPIIICDNCLTMQVPKQVYEGIKKESQSNIITPGGPIV